MLADNMEIYRHANRQARCSQYTASAVGDVVNEKLEVYVEGKRWIYKCK